MMKAKALLRFLTLTLLFGFGLTAHQFATASEQIKLGTSGTTAFLAAYIAFDYGFFQKHGLNVKEVQQVGISGSSQMAALVSGSVDIITGAAPTIIQSYDVGMPITMIANGNVVPDDMKVGIVAREGSAVKSPGDLAGKRIAVTSLNGIMHFAARNWLKEKGVADASVHWMEVPAPQIVSLLKSKQFDAAVVFDPFFTAAVDQKVGYDLGQVWENTPAGTSMAVFATTKQWADKNPEQIKRFQAALTEAASFAQANKEKSIESIAKHTKLPRKVIEQLGMPNLRTDFDSSSLQWWITVLADQKILKKTISTSVLVYP